MEHIRFWASPITLRHMDKMACGSTGTEIMRDCRNKFQVEKSVFLTMFVPSMIEIPASMIVTRKNRFLNQ